jgi:hypothetical protein
MLDKKILRRPFFYDWEVDNDIVYFSMCYYNALCKANLNNDQVEIIGTFPGVPYEKGNEYFGIYRYENYLLLGPIKSTDDFFVYDTLHSQFFKIPNEGENRFYSIRVFAKDHCLYIVTMKTAQVNRIDLKDFSAKCVMHNEFEVDNAQVINVERVDDLLYIPVNQKKKLIIFSIEKGEYSYCRFPSNVSAISTIDYYDGRFWITGEEKKIFAWDVDEKEAQEIVDFPDDIRLFFSRNNWFENSFIYNDCLWLFPAYADLILKYNILTKRLEKFEISGEEEDPEKIDEELRSGRQFASKYNVVKRYGNRAFFFSSKTRIFYEINLQTNKLYKHDFKMIYLYNNQIYPLVGNEIMSEIRYELEGLIRILTKKVTNISVKKEQIIGNIIYDRISKDNK